MKLCSRYPQYRSGSFCKYSQNCVEVLSGYVLERFQYSGDCAESENVDRPVKALEEKYHLDQGKAQTRTLKIEAHEAAIDEIVFKLWINEDEIEIINPRRGDTRSHSLFRTPCKYALQRGLRRIFDRLLVSTLAPEPKTICQTPSSGYSANLHSIRQEFVWTSWEMQASSLTRLDRKPGQSQIGIQSGRTPADHGSRHAQPGQDHEAHDW